MTTALLIWVLAWTLIAFVLMGADKWKARHDNWRVPEKALFLSAIVGALAGMYLFRHKTKHLSFTIGMPVILALQIALVLALRFRGYLAG